MSKRTERYERFRDRYEAFINALKDEKKGSRAKDDISWLDYMERSKYRFFNIAESLYMSPVPLRILDIGTTPFTWLIKEASPDDEVWTIDLGNYLESRCKEAGVQFLTCDLGKGHIPFEDNYFDIVIFCEVLEHLFVPPSRILGEIHRIMIPHGKLIMSVPNIAALYQRIKLLFGISPLPKADAQMADGYHYGHIHEYTMKEITSMLEACNFSIMKKKYVSGKISGEKGMSKIVRRIYDPMVFLVPQFRSTIHIELIKP